jgi:hypothetical protein
MAAAEPHPTGGAGPELTRRISEEADDMSSDLRSPRRQARTAPIKDTAGEERGRQARSALRSGSGQAAKKRRCAPRPTEAKRLRRAEARTPTTRADEAPKKSGGFSFTQTNEQDES